MPLKQSRLRRLTAHRPLKPAAGSNDRIPRFEVEGAAFTATLQPMDTAADRQIYGEHAARMLRLITTEEMDLAMGMGVRVDAPGGCCDYRIMLPVSRWQGHCTAVLEALEP
ncbi:MAG: hypothetical protein IJ041_08905 [Clostridia bacterium]|nr:hypothetical protein [Clostridia bacterium]